jgi:glycolate oxidase iron-sulfur subunit
MQHEISVDQIGAKGEPMAHPISACVHCGFCLPVCPTYKVLGEEMDSPRGRIVLMKNVLEGNITVEDAKPYIDRCLGCVGCVTACPSGVKYGELVVAYRAYTEDKRTRTTLDKLTRKLVSETLPYPNRFRLAAMAGRLGKIFASVMPSPLRAMLSLIPDEIPPANDRFPAVVSAEGKRRARVALLTGCVQQTLAPQINWATIHVLTKNGVEVVVPKNQGCCGSLGMHTGDESSARKLARKNLSVFPSDVDAVITNAAGCGSGMKEYGLLFRGEPEFAQAEAFASKTKDVCEFLDELGIVEPKPLAQPLKIAYHDACHLAHAQSVVGAPRRLLASISNVQLIEIPEGEICCGSAGTYNIEQPEIARELGERKARNILKTNAEAVVTGNIGCMIQIRQKLLDGGKDVEVMHTMEVLSKAYQ